MKRLVEVLLASALFAAAMPARADGSSDLEALLN